MGIQLAFAHKKQTLYFQPSFIYDVEDVMDEFLFIKISSGEKALFMEYLFYYFINTVFAMSLRKNQSHMMTVLILRQAS